MGSRQFHAVVLAGLAAGDDPADKAADRFLRAAEPPEHDNWEVTPDVSGSYARGYGKALTDFKAEVRKAIREVVGRPTRDLSDGPDALKELLRISPPAADTTKRPKVKSAVGKPDSAGRWSRRRPRQPAGPRHARGASARCCDSAPSPARPSRSCGRSSSLRTNARSTGDVITADPAPGRSASPAPPRPTPTPSAPPARLRSSTSASTRGAASDRYLPVRQPRRRRPSVSRARCVIDGKPLSTNYINSDVPEIAFRDMETDRWDEAVIDITVTAPAGELSGNTGWEDPKAVVQMLCSYTNTRSAVPLTADPHTPARWYGTVTLSPRRMVRPGNHARPRDRHRRRGIAPCDRSGRDVGPVLRRPAAVARCTAASPFSGSTSPTTLNAA